MYFLINNILIGVYKVKAYNISKREILKSIYLLKLAYILAASYLGVNALSPLQSGS